jgi:signal transduction histidine kinase
VALQTAEDAAVLSIEDDGDGFDLEIGPKIFDKGVKGKSSQGHGLGLAFVEAVVRVHGGRVEAGNRDQGGAHLCIFWPLHIENSRALDGCVATLQKSGSRAKDGRDPWISDS